MSGRLFQAAGPANAKARLPSAWNDEVAFSWRELVETRKKKRFGYFWGGKNLIRKTSSDRYYISIRLHVAKEADL